MFLRPTPRAMRPNVVVLLAPLMKITPFEKGAVKKFKIRRGAKGEGVVHALTFRYRRSKTLARQGSARLNWVVEFPLTPKPSPSLGRGEPRFSMSFNFLTAPGGIPGGGRRLGPHKPVRSPRKGKNYFGSLEVGRTGIVICGPVLHQRSIGCGFSLD